jgi:hypothetical protein
MPDHRLAGGRLRAVETAGSREAFVQQLQPRRATLPHEPVSQRGQTLFAEGNHVADLDQCEPAHAHRGRIGQRMGVALMPLRRRFEGRQRLVIKAQQQLLGRRRAANLSSLGR